MGWQERKPQGFTVLRADGGAGGAARPGLWANWLWATVCRGDPAQGTEQAGARSGSMGHLSVRDATVNTEHLPGSDSEQD